MSYEPSDVAQQAIDATGFPYTLGSIEDGTREAQLILRAYERCLRQLLRSAHWDMARKTSPLVLLADATNNTPNVGTLVPVPWIYSYAYPVDCVKARYIPWNQSQQNPGTPSGNITPSDPTAPLMTNLTQPPVAGQRIVPARFLIATDANNLGPNPGYETPGMSPATRTVILTNVKYAQLVYTCMQVYPSVWDELFRAAMVAYVASEVALPLWVEKDRKFGLEVRAQNIMIAKEKIKQARISDGNEGWFSSDIKVDWMQNRVVGARNSWWGAASGPGMTFGGYDSVGFSDGTAF